MAICCLPSDIKLIGLAKIAPPVWNRHRGFPLAASTSKKKPSLEPPKTNPPPVDSSPAQGGDFSLNSHSVVPVSALRALIDPVGSTPGIPAIPPPAYQCPGEYFSLSV